MFAIPLQLAFCELLIAVNCINPAFCQFKIVCSLKYRGEWLNGSDMGYCTEFNLAPCTGNWPIMHFQLSALAFSNKSAASSNLFPKKPKPFNCVPHSRVKSPIMTVRITCTRYAPSSQPASCIPRPLQHYRPCCACEASSSQSTKHRVRMLFFRGVWWELVVSWVTPRDFTHCSTIRSYMYLNLQVLETQAARNRSIYKQLQVPIIITICCVLLEFRT